MYLGLARTLIPFAAVLLLFACGDDGEHVPDVLSWDDFGVEDTGLPDQAPPDQALPDAGLDGAADGGGDALPGEGIPPDTGPVFGCWTVTPPAGNNSAAVTLTLDGYDFESGATIELIDLVSGTSTPLGAATVSDTDSDGVNDQAVVTVPANTPQGLYEVKLTNPTSGASATCGTYLSTTEQPPTVTDVTPDTAWEGDPTDTVLSDQPISVKGTGFKPVPTVRFVSVATKQIYQATTTGFISDTALTSVCPSETLGMPVGDYYVDVVNPSSLWARWMVGTTPGIFKITPTPPPVIDDVSPNKVAANAGGGVPAVVVTVTGDYFHANSKLVLLLPGNQTLDITTHISGINVSATGKDTITFTWNNTVLLLPVGIYPLRVINPDDQYDTYFSMQVENSAPGKLNADNWAAASTLNVPRERHASVAGFDVFGNSFIYTVGGTTPASGGLNVRPRTVLTSTEFTEVDVFGNPAATSNLAVQLDASVSLGTMDPKHDALRGDNLLNTPRTGLTLVRAGRWLYAIGGADSDTWDAAKAGQITALKTVERARILGYETQPNLSLPTAQPVTKGLPKGTWYYRVSAVTAEGESLPSREVAALNAGGAISLKWLAVTGATSYLIYRSLASDGRPGSTRLLKAGVTGTSFVDDGQDELAPAPGRLRGTLAAGGSLAAGKWTYRVSATVSGQSETLAGYTYSITTSAGNQTVDLAWDPIPNATYSLYRTDPADSTGGTYLLATGLTTNSHTDDGTGSVDTAKPAPDGTPTIATGSLSYWETLSAQLNSAREGADAVVVKAVDGDPATTNEPSYIFVVGGRSDNTTNQDYLKTTERAQVDPAAGTLGTWTVMQGTGGPVQLNTPRAFFPLLTTQGRQEIPSPPPPPPPPCPDNDGDGFTDCTCGGKDCNDQDATVYPGAPEICGDGKDQDCDQGCSGGSDMPCGTCTNPDADGDGHNRPQCGGNDCNDSDPTIYPGAPEVCGDGIDQDCDGKDLPCNCPVPDKDGDGFDSIDCGGTDCNDNDPTICPDSTKCPEIPCDGIDQDCDGFDMICSVPPGGQPPMAAKKPKMVSLGDLAGPPVCSNKLQLPWWYTAALAAGTNIEEPVHLVVLFGDESYTNPTKNQGLQTAEVALVRKDGTLTAWTLQTSKVQGGTHYYGNDGLLYSDFAFSFQGVLNEDLGVDPPVIQIWNNVYRWQVDTTEVGLWTEPVPATFLYNIAPADALMNEGRVYLSVIRLSAYIFGIGGNAGIDNTPPEGPTDSIERIKQ